MIYGQPVTFLIHEQSYVFIISDDSVTYADQKSKQPYIPGLNYASSKTRKAAPLPEKEVMAHMAKVRPVAAPIAQPQYAMAPPPQQSQYVFNIFEIVRVCSLVGRYFYDEYTCIAKQFEIVFSLNVKDNNICLC